MVLMIDVVTDIPAASELELSFSGLQGTTADRLAVAVSPSVGRFAPAIVAPTRVRPGDLIGHVTGYSGRADEVRAPVAAELRELLARPNQLVGLGQALAWLERISPTGVESE